MMNTLPDNIFQQAAQEVLNNVVSEDNLGRMANLSIVTAKALAAAENSGRFSQGSFDEQFQIVGKEFCENACGGPFPGGHEPPSFATFVKNTEEDFARFERDGVTLDSIVFRTAKSDTYMGKIDNHLHRFYGRLIARGVLLRAAALQAQHG
jgi:hypothetical protein